MTTKSIILQEDCPICISTQSMFIQLGTGIVYPLMSTIGGTYMVNIHRTRIIILTVHYDFYVIFNFHYYEYSTITIYIFSLPTK